MNEKQRAVLRGYAYGVIWACVTFAVLTFASPFIAIPLSLAVAVALIKAINTYDDQVDKIAIKAIE